MSDRESWMRAAKRLAARRNIASWLDAFLSVGLGLTVVAALVLLALRLTGLESHILWHCWGGALFFGALICAAIVCRSPYTVLESLARLDEVGQLHNRLISAFEGIGPWPKPQPGLRDSVRWNWARLGVPALIGGLLLGTAALVDLPKLTMSARPSEEPIAWTQVESWLKTLDQAKLLDQPALDKLKEQVDDLRHQPEQEWYSQSSLEAGDALEQQTGQSLRNLQDNLEKSTELMTQAQQAGQMPASQLQSLSAALKDVAQGMLSGNLPLNKELAGKLRDFDPATLKAMNPDETQALRQRLSEGAKVCSQCVGPHPADGKAVAKAQAPSGPPWGGGPAPLGLDEQGENLHTKRLEGASNEDPSRALPGEVIAIARGRHNVDKTAPARAADGGAISGAGEGGDAVWRDSLTPDERQVLEKYFK